MHDATSFAAVFAVVDVPCSHVEAQLFGKPPQVPEFSKVHWRMAAHPAVEVQVASALAQSLHLLSLQEHKSKEEELLLPPDPALEPELLDEPPVPELDDAPVPELDEPPVPELDDAPVPDPDAELLLPPVVAPAELLLPPVVAPAELLLPPVATPVVLPELPAPWFPPAEVLAPFPPFDDPPPPGDPAVLADETPVTALPTDLGESPLSAAHA